MSMKELISLSHGNGGIKTDELIKGKILSRINNSILRNMGDGALIKMSGNLAFTTDSYIIYPLFFRGGDIGKLSVYGTVNDLIMCGSIPKYLSLSFIIEEGLPMKDFDRIMESVGEAAERAKVKIVTGDTKVVDKGHGHGIYINTAGIGERVLNMNLLPSRIETGDKVIVTGDIGNHGVSIFCEREGLVYGNLSSDCAPLNEIMTVIYNYGKFIKVLRDPTRGGLATVLNEFLENSLKSIELNEAKIPVNPQVRGVCEIFGFDPLYVANEGKCVIVCASDIADSLLKELKEKDIAKDAAIIGEVVDYEKSKVLLRNEFGGIRILEKLSHDMLPRIC